MAAQELFTVSLEPNPLECWDNESTASALLYAGLPAEAIATACLLTLTVPTEDSTTLHELSLALPVSLTIGFIPLAVLSSFILRTVTVTERNAATIPFEALDQES